MIDDAKQKFDWRMAGFTFLLVAAQGFIQWGVIVTKVDDLERRLERVEAKVDEKFLTREEFEKRHQELQRRVEEQREQIQELLLEDRKRR